MHEVGGEGVHLVDPYNVLDIRKAVTLLCADDIYRNKKIDKGYENLQRFQPQKIAQQYLDLYTTIHSNQSKSWC
jgi:glycosyltransferase involved in cell wall biosynthesis